MNIDAAASLTAQPSAGKQASPEKIRTAARDFEALLIGQMMKSMRESSEGWLGTGEDQSADSAMGLAEEQFSKALVAGGGLGLANLMSKDLSGHSR